jgi:hypothetical protein
MEPTTMKISKIAAATCLTLSVAFAGSALAQSTAGTLLGDGKPGDIVAVSNSSFGFSKEVAVRDNGKFRLPGLSPGVYTVVVRHADGSQDAEVQIRVLAGAASRVGANSP